MHLLKIVRPIPPPIQAEARTAGQDSIPLSDIDRLARIGAILYGAACRLRGGNQIRKNHALLDLNVTEIQIYEAVGTLGSAAPEQIVRLIGLSRATISRGLQVLRERGLVVSEGLTRNIRYSVPEQKIVPQPTLEL